MGTRDLGFDDPRVRNAVFMHLALMILCVGWHGCLIDMFDAASMAGGSVLGNAADATFRMSA